LYGNRIVCAENNVILGASSENCRIKSTGLSSLEALITSQWTLPIRNITFEHSLVLNLNALGNANQALDWSGVNFTDCAEVGVVANYTNFIAGDCALLNSQGFTFDGSFGTIAFSNTLFDNRTSGTAIIIPSTTVITRRFRVTYSSFVSLSGETSINVSSSASIPTEGYILDTVNFSGGGSQIVGVDHNDNKSLFINCRGILNSGNISQYYMSSNATITDIVTQDVFVKVAGTTLAGDYVERFSLTDNRATYDGAISGFYKVSALLTLTSGNNNVVRCRISKNGNTYQASESRTTTNGSGRSENVVVSGILELITGDYIEIFVANNTATTDITVSDMNVIIERLN
jgi:hypothetical protein